MSIVECKALSCGYNDCSACKKRSIDVEGLFAKNKIGTFCESFKNPVSTNLLKYEFAKEMTVEGEVLVSCSANNCKYNKAGECKKQNIMIGKTGAMYRSETECDSFKID